MPLQKLQFMSGIVREGTQYTAKMTWHDADKVRFRMGRPEKIGGWRKYTQSSYVGVCRSLHDWSTIVGDNYLGIGTTLKFYVEIGGEISDITPVRSTGTINTDPFTATDGSSVITVTDTSHGAVLNDFVTFSSATGLGGNITAGVLNAEHQITEILTANTYTIDPGVSANATDASGSPGGGASVNGEYQINVGTDSFVPGTGWSVGAWGDNPWGSSVSLSAVNQLRLYSQDVFGDDLLFSPRGGGVYYWDESTGTSARAYDISNLPTASNTPVVAMQVMVSDVDRHVICFGTNPLGSSDLDPLLIRWSDQEDAGNWTPSITNSSGGQVLSVGNVIIGAIKTRREILVFTDAGITSMQFTGAPWVYRFSVVAENVSLIGPNAAITAGDAVFFMDRDGFYVYRGAVERIPCSVYDHVFDNLQREQYYKVFAMRNQDTSEVTWFYPVGDMAADITNYVTYNYLNNDWTIGTMGRGAWIQAPSRDYPIASSNTVGGENYIYNQEFGYDADGEPMEAFIESGAVEIGDGDRLMFIRRLISDFRFTGNENNVDITVRVKGRKFPLENMVEKDVANINAGTGQNHIRARAREVALRIESDGDGYSWAAGDFRLDMREDGRQ